MDESRVLYGHFYISHIELLSETCAYVSTRINNRVQRFEDAGGKTYRVRLKRRDRKQGLTIDDVVQRFINDKLQPRLDKMNAANDDIESRSRELESRYIRKH